MTSFGDYAFRWAAGNGHLDVLRWLWQLREDHGIAIDPTANNREAFESENPEVLEFLRSIV